MLLFFLLILLLKTKAESINKMRGEMLISSFIGLVASHSVWPVEKNIY